MYKYIIIFLLLLLQACSKPLPEYLAKEKLRAEFKEKANASCSLNYLDNSKDILVASIYFKDFNSDLSNADKEVIREVVEIQRDCAKNILLVGHSSSLEEEITEKDGFVNGAKLSFERVKLVAKELQKNKIFGNYINISFCGASNNLVEEKLKNKNQKNAHLYNQRVDIVFLNNSVNNYEFGCIPDLKK